MALFNYPSRSSYSAKAAQFVIAAIIVLIASIMIHRGPTHARHMVNNVWYLDLLGAGAVTMAIVLLGLACSTMFLMALLALFSLAAKLRHPLGWAILNVFLLLKWIIAIPVMAILFNGRHIRRGLGVPRAFLITFAVFELLATCWSLFKDVSALRAMNSHRDVDSAKDRGTIDGAADDAGFRIAVLNAGLP